MKTLLTLLFFGLIQAVKFKDSSLILPKLLMTQVQDTGPLSHSYEILDKLLEEIHSEQNEHDGMYEQQAKKCDEEIAFRQKEFGNTHIILSQIKSSQNLCESSLEIFNRKLTAILNDQESMNSHKDSAEEAKKHIDLAYKTKELDHSQLVDSIEDCINAIEALKISPAAFAELPEKASSLIVASSKVKKTSQVAPIISALVELSQVSQGDKIPLERIIRLLQDLKVSSKESKADFDKIAEKSSELFSDLYEKLDSELNKLKNEEIKIRDQLSQHQNCVASQSNLIEKASEKDNRHSSILNSVQKLCENWRAQYDSQSENRKKEIETIEGIKNVLQRRYGEYKLSSVDRADKYKEDWDRYTNVYVYQNQWNYQHHQREFEG